MIRNTDTVIQVRLWNTRKYETLVSAGHILMESIPTQNISKENGTEQMQARVTHFDVSSCAGDLGSEATIKI